MGQHLVGTNEQPLTVWSDYMIRNGIAVQTDKREPSGFMVISIRLITLADIMSCMLSRLKDAEATKVQPSRSSHKSANEHFGRYSEKNDHDRTL